MVLLEVKSPLVTSENEISSDVTSFASSSGSPGKKKRVKKNRDQLITKTLQFKLRNPQSSWLEKASSEVNAAWNYANATSFKAIVRYHGKPVFLSSFDLNNLTAGSSWSAEQQPLNPSENPSAKPSKEPNPHGFTHISNAVVQEINKEYVTRRTQFKKRKLKWRVSTGSKKSLGWIPFKQESLTINWSGLKIAGKMDNGVRLQNIDKASHVHTELSQKNSPKKAFRPSITCMGRHLHIFNEDYLLEHLLDLAAKVVSGNLAQDSLGVWHLNLVIEMDRSIYMEELKEKGFPEIAPREVLGIDPGSKLMLACSDGTLIEPPKFYREQEQKLASLQKNGRKKQAKRLHQAIKNQRKDHAHKVSSEIVKNNQIIKWGNLNVKGLVKRKKTKKKRQEKSNTKKTRAPRFGKSLLDNGLGQIKAFISVKSHWAGRTFHVVNEQYTTQVCSNCGALTGPKGLKQLVVRKWVCSACKTEHHRDLNSSGNIADVEPGKTIRTSAPRCGHLFAEMKPKSSRPFSPDPNKSTQKHGSDEMT